MWRRSSPPRRLLVIAGTFALVLVLGGCPSARVAQAFSAAYCPLADVVLGAITFGRGGHARLQPRDPPTVRADDPIVADTQVMLNVDGQPREARLGISLRRDAYLPLLILLATVLAAPLTWRCKLRLCGYGLLIELGVTLVAVVLLVGSALAAGVRGLYEPRTVALWDLASRTLLLPPGNRFMIPLCIGIGLSWWGCRPGGDHS